MEEISEYIEESETEITTIPEIEIIISHVSEINSYISVTAENTEAIKEQADRVEILLFAVICFIGVVCGLLGALTWRSNKNG